MARSISAESSSQSAAKESSPPPPPGGGGGLRLREVPSAFPKARSVGLGEPGKCLPLPPVERLVWHIRRPDIRVATKDNRSGAAEPSLATAARAGGGGGPGGGGGGGRVR